ncbi:MAG: hypothetical protein ACXWLV_13215, partial [Rhizomicrobium sp.]
MSFSKWKGSIGATKRAFANARNIPFFWVGEIRLEASASIEVAKQTLLSGGLILAIGTITA